MVLYAVTGVSRYNGYRHDGGKGGGKDGGNSGSAASSGDFDSALLAEKDHVIRDVRKTFSSCSDKIGSLEQMLGLGGAGAGLAISNIFID